MSIELPTLFEESLEGHNREKGIVHSALATFGDWFEADGTPLFFRDYTDHGTKHISNVLATAAAMIPDQAFGCFSGADTVVLVLAALLHDSALHLAEPGFRHLIHGDASDRRIWAFDGAEWPVLWDEFLFSARRWNERERSAVFGDEFVQAGHGVSDPSDHWGNLSLVDCKLIGEFLRRHHHRLAHEFAVFGVPGVRADFLTLPASVSDKWRDLSGVVARTHGLPLRTCLDYVTKHYHKRDYQGIHAVYLMTLLRLADYLQIDASRAPEVVFRYRVLPSQISNLEWRSHNAVKNITPEHEDPESVEIHAEPPDVETYLRLREWLDGIQCELDTSWAVLGEIYGRYPNLRGFGLQWRRVRSNLDDCVAFASTVPYLPRRIRLEVARAEMLSLLIGPLYGDDPSYGVRELIQNAVDAVREREYLQQRHPEYAKADLREQKADVVVWLGDFDEKANCAWLEVSDRGVGMTEKVLTDYFLTAGASYRRSDQWQRTFERTDLPEDEKMPRAAILRSGRFGVGALATFLIGEEIEVETRHIVSSTGLRFRMHLTQEAVQIERVNNLHVGTRIRVKVSYHAFEKLLKQNDTVSKPGLWDWYVIDKPTVLRLMGKDKQPIECHTKIDLGSWRVAETNLPLTIYWSMDAQAPALCCNGIFVSNSAKLPAINAAHCGSQEYCVFTPRLHVFDPDGHLPLGLTRKEVVSEEYGFERDLALSIIKDYFARILVKFPEALDAKSIGQIIGKTPFGMGYAEKGYTGRKLSCFFTNDGFCLPFNRSLGAYPRDIRNILWVDSMEALEIVPALAFWDCVALQRRAPEPGLDSSYRRKNPCCFAWNLASSHRREDVLRFRYTDNRTIPVDKRQVPARDTDSPPNRDGAKGTWITWEPVRYDPGGNSLTHQDEPTEYRTRWLVQSPDMPPSRYPFELLLRQHPFDPRDIPFVAEYILADAWREPIEAGALNDWWCRFFGNEWIPWKKADRRAKFRKTYEELAPYIARYET